MTKSMYEYTALKWSFRVPKDYYYIENDFWVRIEKPYAYIGIKDYIQIMMGDIIFIESKEVGTHITLFGDVAALESTKTMLDLLSPISGEIVEINEKIISSPHLLNAQPYEENWIVKLRILDFEGAKEFLLDAKQYFEILKRKIDVEKDKMGKEE